MRKLPLYIFINLRTNTSTLQLISPYNVISYTQQPHDSSVALPDFLKHSPPENCNSTHLLLHFGIFEQRPITKSPSLGESQASAAPEIFIKHESILKKTCRKNMDIL